MSEGRSDAEVIDNYTEEGRTGRLGEETGSMVCGHVAEFGEMLDKATVSELTSLEKNVHAFAGFNENVAIVDEGCELVLLHDAGGKYFDWNSHVLVMLQRSGFS